MIKIIMLLFCVIYSTVSYAADWQYINKYSKATVYIDKSSIENNAKTKIYWRKHVYFEPEVKESNGQMYSIKSTTSRIEMDCSQKKYKHKGIQIHDEDGKSLGYTDFDNTSDFELIVPGSHVESEFAYVCMYNSKYDKEQDLLINKGFAQFFKTFKRGGMIGVRDNTKKCYNTNTHIKKKKDLEFCGVLDLSAYFMQLGAKSHGIPEMDYFKSENLLHRIDEAYIALGYNEIQRKIAATVLYDKVHDRFNGAADKYLGD